MNEHIPNFTSLVSQINCNLPLYPVQPQPLLATDPLNFLAISHIHYTFGVPLLQLLV